MQYCWKVWFELSFKSRGVTDLWEVNWYSSGPRCNEGQFAKLGPSPVSTPTVFEPLMALGRHLAKIVSMLWTRFQVTGRRIGSERQICFYNDEWRNVKVLRPNNCRMHLDGGSLHVDVVTIIMMLTIHCNIRNISVMSGDVYWENTCLISVQIADLWIINRWNYIHIFLYYYYIHVFDYVSVGNVYPVSFIVIPLNLIIVMGRKLLVAFFKCEDEFLCSVI